MDLPAHIKKAKKNNPFTLAVLNLPPQSAFIPVPSGASHQKMVYFCRKKVNLAVVGAEIPKLKLLTNLEAYEWRNQTEFPIVKIRYVRIKEEHLGSSNLAQLQVYCQYCPLLLSRIHQITLGQALYLLKQCIVGFERLFSRFGGFEISQNMIAFNEKGCCRVWLNQSFAYNSPQKRGCKEEKMIQKIINLIEAHSTDTKSSRKLFLLLKSPSSFLSALKIIQNFCSNSQILVPNKFLLINSTKDISKPEDLPLSRNNQKDLLSISNSIRFSVKSNKRRKGDEKFKKELLSNASSFRRLSNSPLQIHRFKSQQKISSFLKTSGVDTAHTKTQIDPKTSVSNFGSQVQSIKDNSFVDSPGIQSKSSKKMKWVEQPEYRVGEEISSPENTKKKKQLSHSEAFQLQQPKSSTDGGRKFSINYLNSKIIKDSPVRRFNQIYNQKEQTPYTQFASILRDNERSEQLTPRDNDSIEDMHRLREHSDAVIKNNGWTSNFNVLMNTPKQLRESIHAGEEQNLSLKDLKLEKLESIGRREVSMSILPEQYEDCY